jgi:uncharacterized protein YqjF (DUF2071 family)
MTQTWHDLLFAHWPVDPGRLRALVPAPFPLDLFDEQAWIGVVPFHMTNVSPRGVPPLPWLSTFPELNVRTYVRVDDRPGVYFFSLDAGNSLAVHAARALLNMPYHSAAMTVVPLTDGVDYRSSRVSGPAEFSARYGPTGRVFAAATGSLEHFLMERYCLYNVNRRGAPYRLEIHHPPWPLQPAQAQVDRNTMARASGVTLPDRSPLLHFSKRQDVVVWRPRTLR